MRSAMGGLIIWWQGMLRVWAVFISCLPAVVNPHLQRDCCCGQPQDSAPLRFYTCRALVLGQGLARHYWQGKLRVAVLSFIHKNFDCHQQRHLLLWPALQHPTPHKSRHFQNCSCEAQVIACSGGARPPPLIPSAFRLLSNHSALIFLLLAYTHAAAALDKCVRG